MRRAPWGPKAQARRVLTALRPESGVSRPLTANLAALGPYFLAAFFATFLAGFFATFLATFFFAAFFLATVKPPNKHNWEQSPQVEPRHKADGSGPIAPKHAEANSSCKPADAIAGSRHAWHGFP